MSTIFFIVSGKLMTYLSTETGDGAQKTHHHQHKKKPFHTNKQTNNNIITKNNATYTTATTTTWKKKREKKPPLYSTHFLPLKRNLGWNPKTQFHLHGFISCYLLWTSTGYSSFLLGFFFEGKYISFCLFSDKVFDKVSLDGYYLQKSVQDMVDQRVCVFFDFAVFVLVFGGVCSQVSFFTKCSYFYLFIYLLMSFSFLKNYNFSFLLFFNKKTTACRSHVCNFDSTCTDLYDWFKWWK